MVAGGDGSIGPIVAVLPGNAGSVAGAVALGPSPGCSVAVGSVAVTVGVARNGGKMIGTGVAVAAPVGWGVAAGGATSVLPVVPVGALV